LIIGVRGEHRITERREHMKTERKETDKKRETLRPWLIDVAVEHLR